ncbi:MAG: TIM barrel protein [Clostridia bacterium]|nr:TIM barrel protein [Clostridia bacterium]
MFTPGLVSISFRKYTPEQIIEQAKAAGLCSIEWGSDVHVPPDNPARAKEIMQRTTDAGLSTAAYGSYYRLGQGADFEPYVETAAILQAPYIRVWAGTNKSWQYRPEERAALVEESRKIGDMAKQAGITVTFEYHSDTLTDDYHSALDLMAQINHPHVRMYWQPSQFHTFSYNLDGAKAMAPYTKNIHVFHWDAFGRYPLEQGRSVWLDYLSVFRSFNQNYGALLEFMHDDRLESLIPTAKVLRELIDETESAH